MLRLSLGLALLASGFLGGTAIPALAQTKVGVAAAVNQELTGTPPTATARNITIGNDVFHRERLVTNAQGQAQMLFLDGSAFTVGPDSDLVLDEFVYDPATGTGKLAATAAKGLVRFVGGKLSKNQPVTLATPTATIGIRGGIALVSIDRTTGATNATFLFGTEMTVAAANGAIERIARPGFTTTVQSRSTAPTPPTKVSAEQLKQTNEQLNGRPGATGGAAQAPTEGQVAAQLPPPPPPGQLPPPPPPSGDAQRAAAPPPPPPIDPRDAQEANQTGSGSGGTGTGTGGGTVVPPGAVVAYRLDPDPALGSGLPSVRGQATGGAGNGSSSPLFAVSGGSTGTTVGVQVAIAIDGSGSAQRSVVMVTTGEVGADGVMTMNSRGTSRASTAEGPYQIGAGSTLTGSFAGGRMPDSFVQSGQGGDARLFPQGGGTYTFQQTGTRAANPVVGTRESTVLVGYAAGLVDGIRQDGRPVETAVLLGGFGATPAVDPGSVIISTDAQTGRLGAIFQLTDPDPQRSQTTQSFTDVALFFGFEAGRSAYVDNTRFAAVDTSFLPATITTELGTQTANRTELYMVTGGFSSTLPGGVQACQCQFVQWGWWGATIGSLDDGNVQSVYRVHMGNWVAGPLITASDMPTTGSASYAGHAVGSVFNNGARYQAAGSFAAQFDFGSRQGSMTISNFDGMTMSGAIAGNGGTSYSSDLAVSGRAGLVGRAVGSFFPGAGDPVRETGGQFGLRPATGTTTQYGATGIFVGKKQ